MKNRIKISKQTVMSEETYCKQNGKGEKTSIVMPLVVFIIIKTWLIYPTQYSSFKGRLNFTIFVSILVVPFRAIELTYLHYSFLVTRMSLCLLKSDQCM